MEGELYRRKVTVQNKVGLHARPTTFFIQKANEFKSSVWIEKNGRKVNMNSLLSILSLEIMGEVDVVGYNKEEVDALAEWLESDFTENHHATGYELNKK